MQNMKFNMAQYSCPECGFPLRGNEPFCPECRVPFSYEPQHNINSQSQNNNISIADEGDNEAEDILRNWLKWIRTLIIVISILGGIGLIIWGFMVASMSYGGEWFAVLGIVGGAINILIGWGIANFVWAVGMVFVNISTNVRLIKKSIK